MGDAVSLNHLISSISPDTREQITPVLRRLAHDLNTPVATLTMDLFSARRLLDRLQNSRPSASGPEAVQGLSDLAEVCANLELTVTNLTQYARAFSELAAHPADLTPNGATSAEPRKKNKA